jgi:hypothetical protein
MAPRPRTIRSSTLQRAVSARRGWTWGASDGESLRAAFYDHPPRATTLVLLCDRIEYSARKGALPAARWVHDFDAPLPALVQAGGRQAARRMGSPSVLTVLGELLALEGLAPDGARGRIDFPRGAILACAPPSHRLIIVRTDDARRTLPALWFRGGAYRLTEAGIVG